MSNRQYQSCPPESGYACQVVGTIAMTTDYSWPGSNQQSAGYKKSTPGGVLLKYLNAILVFCSNGF